jgi:hypothetical protein
VVKQREGDQEENAGKLTEKEIWVANKKDGSPRNCDMGDREGRQRRETGT